MKLFRTALLLYGMGVVIVLVGTMLAYLLTSAFWGIWRVLAAIGVL